METPHTPALSSLVLSQQRLHYLVRVCDEIGSPPPPQGDAVSAGTVLPAVLRPRGCVKGDDEAQPMLPGPLKGLGDEQEKKGRERYEGRVNAAVEAEYQASGLGLHASGPVALM